MVKKRRHDDTLLVHLEAKLGLKGCSKQRRALEKQIEDEEFGGESMMEFLDCIIQDKPLDNILDEEELEEFRSINAMNGKEGDRSDNDDDEEDDEEEEDDDEEEVNTVSSDGDLPQRAAKKLENGKYVPPSLRNAGVRVSSRKSEIEKSCEFDWSSLRQALRSLFNRASEGNLSVVLADFQKTLLCEKEKLGFAVFGDSGKQQQLKTEFVKNCESLMSEEALLCFRNRTSARLLAPQMAVVIALSHVLNRRVLLKLLNSLIRETIMALKGGDDDPLAKEVCRFQLTGVCILSIFGGIGGSFLAAILRQAITLCESAELLFEVCGFALRLVGPGLKEADPTALANIISIYTDLKDRLLLSGSLMKAEFMNTDLEKVGQRNELHQKLIAMKNWLNTLRGTTSIVYEPADPASVVEKVLDGDDLAEIHGVAIYDEPEKVQISVGTDHTSMAKSLGIKTPFQIQLFGAMMDSDGVDDSVARLLSFGNNKKKLIPHVIALVLHCAVHQKIYNPFYEEVLAGLSMVGGSRYKVAIRQGLHSLSSTVSSVPRRLAILAKICLDLSAKGVVTMQDSLIAKLDSACQFSCLSDTPLGVLQKKN